MPTSFVYGGGLNIGDQVGPSLLFRDGHEFTLHKALSVFTGNVP